MYDTILLPADGSERALDAADHAFGIARQYDATVHALSVVDTRNRFGGESTAGDAAAAGMSEETRGADDAVRAVRDRAPDDVPVTTQVAFGVLHERILATVAERAVDLVVMGSHGRTGLRGHPLGSVTEWVLRATAVPVLVTSDEGPPDP